MDVSIWFWIGFNTFILALLTLDLGVFHRKAHAVSFKEAVIWSIIWVSLSLSFCATLLFYAGSEIALTFLTGYLVEYSLSVDNIFVFVLLFTFFRVPAAFQHRVLFWGILSALIMRGTLILAGAYLLARFHWIIYLFGAFLVVTGIRMAVKDEKPVNLDQNLVVRLVRRLLPVTGEYRGTRFFVREQGMLAATPLLIVLAMIEVTDLIFAFDSIPAIFGVTRDPFLVYTSNVFAILGLRSMYFMLAGVVQKFHLLKYGLALILTFVGVKMLMSELYHLPTVVSLGFIVAVLAIAILASLLFPAVEEHAEAEQEAASRVSDRRPR